jgi:hypothetical protein
MTIREILTNALVAAGGYERIRAIRSYRAEMRCEWPERGLTSTTLVWRAVGGRVRIEEFSRRGRTVRVVNGDVGVRVDEEGSSGAIRRDVLAPEDVAAIRHDARVAPRNLLAHAFDYELIFAGLVKTPNGSRIALQFPAEQVNYFFDSTTYHCTHLFDVRDRSVAFDDYRMVAGIATPFVERVTSNNGTESCVKNYTSVSYDLDLPADLFEVGTKDKGQ